MWSQKLGRYRGYNRGYRPYRGNMVYIVELWICLIFWWQLPKLMVYQHLFVSKLPHNVFMITPAKKGWACQLFARCWNWNLTNYQNWLGLEMKTNRDEHMLTDKSTVVGHAMSCIPSLLLLQKLLQMTFFTLLLLTTSSFCYMGLFMFVQKRCPKTRTKEPWKWGGPKPLDS